MLFKLGLQYPDRLPPVVRAELEQLIAAIQQQSTNEIPVINIPMGSLIVTPDQIHGGSPGSVLLGLDSGRFLSTYLTAGPGIGLAPASGALTISALGGGGSGGGPGIPGRDGEDAECFILPGAVGPTGAAGVGGLTLVESHTASASASLLFTTRNAPGFSGATFQADYPEYVIEFVNLVPAVNDTGSLVSLSTNGGVSYDTGANYDVTMQYTAPSFGPTNASSAGAGGIMGFGNISNTAVGGLTGYLRIYDPTSTVSYKRLMGMISFNHSSIGLIMWPNIYQYRNTAAVNAFRFAFNSGNIASGTIRVYGVGPSTAPPPGPAGPIGPMGLVVPGLDGDDASCYCVGERGPQGEPGASTSVMAYRAETTSTAANDPGAGLMRWNNATQSAATALYIDRLTENKFDATAVLATMGQQDQFIVQDRDIAAAYQVWKQTGPAINHSDWFEVPVSFVSSSGQAQFTNQQRLSILLKTAGVIAPHQTSHQVGGSDELLNAAWTNRVNQFTMNQRISNAGGDFPRLTLTNLNLGADQKVVQLINIDENLNFWFVNDAETQVLASVTITRDGGIAAGNYLRAGTNVYEKGRSEAMGHWIDVPFDPANFPNVSGASAPVNQYMLVGNTLTWQLYLSGQIVAQATDLLMTCPVNHLPMYMSGGCGHSYYNGSFGGAIGSSLQWITNPSDPTIMMIRNAQYLAGINPGLFEVMFTAVYRIA